MIQAPDLPPWAAILVGLLVLAGAIMTLIGSIGLVRFKTFYERVHPPTIGTTLGGGLIILGSVLCYSILQSRLLLHEVLIALFVSLTTPVSLMLLARAALYRDRTMGVEGVPPAERGRTEPQAEHIRKPAESDSAD